MPSKYCLPFFFWLIYAWLGPSNLLVAQNQRAVDSLHRIFPRLDDTTKVLALAQLCVSFRTSVPDSGFFYARKTYQQAQRLAYRRGQGIGLMRIGSVQYYLSNFDSALYYYKAALVVFEEIPDGSNIASVLNNIGGVYSVRGDYKTALGYYFKAEEEAKRYGDRAGQAYSNVTIGSIYRVRGDTVNALEYYRLAEKIYREMNDRGGLAISLHSMGGIYAGQHKYDSAIYKYREAMAIRTELGDRNGLAYNLNKIADIYRLKGMYKPALENAKQAMEIYRLLGQRAGQANVLINYAQIYQAQDDCAHAIGYGEEGLALARKLNIREGVSQATQVLAKCFAARGDYAKAYQYQVQHLAVHDSIFSQENNRLIAQLQIEMAHKGRAALISEIDGLENNQFWQWIALVGVGLCLLVSIGFVYALSRNVRQQQAANQLLGLQKKEIEQKNRILENQATKIVAQRDALDTKNSEIARKNDDIMASISYAQRIQSAILPAPDLIKGELVDHFVFFKPRDVVSGDFYWFAKIIEPGSGRTKTIIAAIDCTGHGVPGAFMSIIANTLLKNIVISNRFTSPGLILSALHQGVWQALRQAETHNNDGMEIGLCIIDLEEREVTFAGARIPLVLAQYSPEGVPELIEIRGDKTSVGGKLEPKRTNTFQQHTVQLPIDKKTVLYLFSDGFQDQFGGPNNKKFMAKRFRALIGEICKMNMDEQRDILRQTIDQWMAASQQPQVDDILVLGVRL